MSHPVVVFQGRTEFEAQMARDVLQSALIPVYHLPSLSTGIFGVPQTTRVAVPEEYVETALTTLREAGMAGDIADPPTGVAAFRDAVDRGLPLARITPLTRGSRLSWTLILLLALVGAVIVAGIVLVRRNLSSR